jgi:hypothetical protein
MSTPTPRLSIVELAGGAPTQVVYGSPSDIRVTIGRSRDWVNLDSPAGDGAGGTIPVETSIRTNTIIVVRAIATHLAEQILAETGAEGVSP